MGDYMKKIYLITGVIPAILLVTIMTACSMPANGNIIKKSVEKVQPKPGKALLLLAPATGVSNDVAVLINDRLVGTLNQTTILAVHTTPGDYVVRSSYQDGFPVEVILRRGEQLLLLAHNTGRGLYFKPAHFDPTFNPTQGKVVIEVDY